MACTYYFSLVFTFLLLENPFDHSKERDLCLDLLADIEIQEQIYPTREYKASFISLQITGYYDTSSVLMSTCQHNAIEEIRTEQDYALRITTCWYDQRESIFNGNLLHYETVVWPNFWMDYCPVDYPTPNR